MGQIDGDQNNNILWYSAHEVLHPPTPFNCRLAFTGVFQQLFRHQYCQWHAAVAVIYSGGMHSHLAHRPYVLGRYWLALGACGDWLRYLDIQQRQ